MYVWLTIFKRLSVEERRNAILEAKNRIIANIEAEQRSLQAMEEHLISEGLTPEIREQARLSLINSQSIYDNDMTLFSEMVRKSRGALSAIETTECQLYNHYPIIEQAIGGFRSICETN